MAALKFDAGKPRLDLIPPRLLEQLGIVFDYGAQKYTRPIEVVDTAAWLLDKLRANPSVHHTLLEHTSPSGRVRRYYGTAEGTLRRPSLSSYVPFLTWLKSQVRQWFRPANDRREIGRYRLSILMVDDDGTERAHFAVAADTEWGCLHAAVLELGARQMLPNAHRYTVQPPVQLDSAAQVLESGERNWEQGFTWGRPYAALQRHLTSWWGGENTDPETGFSHLSHAACCLAMLVEFEATHPELDTRPQPHNKIDEA